MKLRFREVKELITKSQQISDRIMIQIQFFLYFQQKNFFSTIQCNTFKVNQNEIQGLGLLYSSTYVLSFKVLKYIHMHHFIRFDQYGELGCRQSRYNNLHFADKESEPRAKVQDRERETEFCRWVQLSLEVSLFDASIFSFGLNSWLKRDRSQKAVLGAGFCGIRVGWSFLAEGS